MDAVTYIKDLVVGMQPIDFVDIGILSVIIYWLLSLIRGTRASLILLGLTVILGGYAASSIIGLNAIEWVFNVSFNSAVIIIVVLFQADIRNALARIGVSTIRRDQSQPTHNIMLQIAKAAVELSKQRVGAIIVLEKEIGLKNFIDSGVIIDALIESRLLVTLFQKSSPLHDGAVIIDKHGKIAAASCVLPLSNAELDSALGTRHRGGLGLSEEGDAVVLIVSEESGAVSLAHRGQIKTVSPNLNKLQAAMRNAFYGENIDPASVASLNLNKDEALV